MTINLSLLPHFHESGQINPDYEDDAKEVLKTIKIVLKHTNNKGICYLDDLSLSPEVTTQIILESDFDFISLANNVNSKIEYESHQYSASDLAEKLDTRFGKMMYKLIQEFKVILRVKAIFIV